MAGLIVLIKSKCPCEILYLVDLYVLLSPVSLLTWSYPFSTHWSLRSSIPTWALCNCQSKNPSRYTSRMLLQISFLAQVLKAKVSWLLYLGRMASKIDNVIHFACFVTQVIVDLVSWLICEALHFPRCLFISLNGQWMETYSKVVWLSETLHIWQIIQCGEWQ